jgi:hypothetical protein
MNSPTLAALQLELLEQEPGVSEAEVQAGYYPG